MTSPALTLTLTLTLAAALMAAPALAQDAAATDPAKPVIILPAPDETDARLQTTPDSIKPVGGSGCSRGKAVTS